MCFSLLQACKHTCEHTVGWAKYMVWGSICSPQENITANRAQRGLRSPRFHIPNYLTLASCLSSYLSELLPFFCSPFIPVQCLVPHCSPHSSSTICLFFSSMLSTHSFTFHIHPLLFCFTSPFPTHFIGHGAAVLFYLSVSH